jgi:lipopolysaccharide/colanic/teichoic acid biosynthesis glycosyltransferase
LLVSLPLWPIIGLAIRLEDRGAVFYLQERVGRGGRLFKSIKFRSMRPDAEKGLGPTQAEENDVRITKTGRFLRKAAMDELPQLLNIFKGDMSFVGPRALRAAEIESTGGSQAKSIFEVPGFEKRSSIRPGLTGLAQVLASRKLSREEKFKYDLWYIENRSFWLDIKLITASFLRTFRARWDV